MKSMRQGSWDGQGPGFLKKTGALAQGQSPCMKAAVQAFVTKAVTSNRYFKLPPLCKICNLIFSAIPIAGEQRVLF